MEIPVEELIYRCEYCREPVLYSDIQNGGCLCGSRRVRIAVAVTDEEMQKLKERGYDYKQEHWLDKSPA